MQVSVVVPVYNSKELLKPLVKRLRPVLDDVAETYELILINDGSRDKSWDAICKLLSLHEWIRGINLMRNYGQHNALLCGIRAARFEVIVTMDDDLQHPPEEIPKLLAKLDEGHDVVYGSPEKERHGLCRNIASMVTKIALKSAMDTDVARNVSAFRAFRTCLRDAFANYMGSFISIDVLLTWGTTRFTAIQVKHDPRRVGVSNYSFRKLISHGVNMMTGFSTLPLQIASIIGLLLTLFGVLVLVWVLVRYLLEGSVVAGFPFLASIIAIFSGAQMFALGIIGEYLSRMHFRLMDRPTYVVAAKGDNGLLVESIGDRPQYEEENDPRGD